MQLFDTACDETDINFDTSKEKGENTSVDSGNDTIRGSHISENVMNLKYHPTMEKIFPPKYNLNNKNGTSAVIRMI